MKQCREFVISASWKEPAYVLYEDDPMGLIGQLLSFVSQLDPGNTVTIECTGCDYEKDFDDEVLPDEDEE